MVGRTNSRHPLARSLARLCGVLMVAGVTPLAAQSSGRDAPYRLDAGGITIDTPAHWDSWSLPTHAVRIDPAGVTPRRFRGRYNVLDDRGSFARKLTELKRSKTEHAIHNIDSVDTRDVQGNIITQKIKGVAVPVQTYRVRMGISRVGSNPSAAANILDGDPSTYWEPDPTLPIDDWWVEIDLGRVVTVDSLVVRFVDESLGDPFRQFRVLVAPGQEPILENARKVGLELVGRTTGPNTERELAFSFEQPSISPEWTGRLVETIRIVVTSSRFGRGAQLTEEQWQTLDPADRGDILYYVKAVEGFEEPETQQVYDSLPTERQGRREFFRRERPRLADIEVQSWGDNLSLGMVEGGGSAILSGGGFSPAAAFDGDYSTTFIHPVREKTSIVDRGVLTIDMGATFWLDAMRLSSTWQTTDGYLVEHSDGTLDTSGQPIWRRLSPREREDVSTERYRNILDTYAEPTRARFLRMITFSSGLRGLYYQGPKILEYQLITEGYPAEVLLTSGMIKRPEGRDFSAISWLAETPPGTQVEIRSRTGDLQRKVVRYYDKQGNELAQRTWNNMLGSYKGPADTALVVGSDWSNWSRRYQHPGELLTSPARKSFLQLQVRLMTQDRVATAVLQAIELSLHKPITERVVGELWPTVSSAPGRLDTFDLFLRPFLVESPATSRSVGFDELLLRLPQGNHMQLLELEIGGEDDLSSVHYRQQDGLVNSRGENLTMLANLADSIQVRLPARVQALPSSPLTRTYYRVATDLDPLPVGHDGEFLTGASFGLLDASERGTTRYYRRTIDTATKEESLVPVDQATYDGLDDGDRAVRYFRLLADAGGQFPFDGDGEPLDRRGYESLAASEHGRVVGDGPLIRVRFAAPIFFNGTTLSVAVRNTASGTDTEAPWQSVEAGDAHSQISSEALAVRIPLHVRGIARLEMSPSPFTPNGDGVNDETHIDFEVLNLGAPREARVRIYSLDGRVRWEQQWLVGSGQQSIPWHGMDDTGTLVPPGIYICQVDVDVDDRSSNHTTAARLVYVAY
jgi:hypothetical protein